MNLIKSPHDLLLEKAGLAPQSPGMVNTAPQMLLNQSGAMPHFSEGGSMPSTGTMEADLIANNQVPPRFQFSEGGQVQGVFSQAEFEHLHPLFVALGFIDPKDNIKYTK